jgi:hypothetical protein
MDPSVLEQIPLPAVHNHYNMTSTSQQYAGYARSGAVPEMLDPTLHQSASRPFSMYDSRPPVYATDVRRDAVGHLHTTTPLNQTFFSQANIDGLQQKIQDQVFLMSGNKHRIDRQSDDELIMIMRSYYLMFGRNDPTQVAQELEDLNRRVVGYASAKIFSELDFYLFYRQDIAQFPEPIARPTNAHVYGTRYGELKSFL